MSCDSNYAVSQTYTVYPTCAKDYYRYLYCLSITFWYLIFVSTDPVTTKFYIRYKNVRRLSEMFLSILFSLNTNRCTTTINHYHMLNLSKVT